MGVVIRWQTSFRIWRKDRWILGNLVKMQGILMLWHSMFFSRLLLIVHMLHHLSMDLKATVTHHEPVSSYFFFKNENWNRCSELGPFLYPIVIN